MGDSRAARAVPWILVLVWATATVGARPAGANEAWKERLGNELARLEAAVAAKDGKAAVPGTLLERTVSVHTRLAALETAAGLATGAIQGKDDLAALTQDVGVLKTRLRAIDKPPPASGSPSPAPPEPGKEGASAGKKPATEEPKPPAGPVWPARLRFSATARINYEETGFLAVERATLLGFPDTPFLMDGYKGALSFSLRAKGLVRPLKFARVLVRVRMKGPFTQAADEFRTYEVDWVADRVLSDEALRTWTNHDTLTVDSPKRWIRGPRRVADELSVEAHVLSATTADGKDLAFEGPDPK